MNAAGYATCQVLRHLTCQFCGGLLLSTFLPSENNLALLVAITIRCASKRMTYMPSQGLSASQVVQACKALKCLSGTWHLGVFMPRLACHTRWYKNEGLIRTVARSFLIVRRSASRGTTTSWQYDAPTTGFPSRVTPRSRFTC